MTANTAPITVRYTLSVGPSDCPAATITSADHRMVAAASYRLAARLELASPLNWAVGVSARRGYVWIESSSDDEAARAEALRVACKAEFGK